MLDMGLSRKFLPPKLGFVVSRLDLRANRRFCATHMELRVLKWLWRENKVIIPYLNILKNKLHEVVLTFGTKVEAKCAHFCT